MYGISNYYHILFIFFLAQRDGSTALIQVYVVVRALGSVGGVTMAWPVYRHNVKVCVGNGAVNTLCHMFKHQGVT